MNYDRLLALMPAELRGRLEAETVYAPWLRRGQALERLWQDDVVLETVYNRLAPAERTVLDAVVRRIGCEPFDDARLERSVGAALSGAEVQAGFAGIRRKGLVFAFRKSWGELVYLLPEDALPRWQRILYPLLGERAAAERLDPGSIELQAGGGREPVIAIFDILTLIAKQDMKLTKNGTLPKKAVQRLNEGLPWQDECFQGVSLKYAYADVYPLKTALVLDMLLKMGLLEMDDEGLRLQEEQLRAFLHATRARQNERLYRLWKELAFPAYAWQQHAVLLLETIPEGEWFAPEMLLSSLRRYGLAEGAENSDDAAERVRLLREQWLEPLTGLGWLERGCIGLGREGQGGASTYYRWRWRAAGTEGEAVEEMPGAFLVQPDFEILVPPDVPLWVQWELICLCDPPVRDVLSVTKLTKASLKYALEQGRTADDVLHFLEEHAAYGLPDNVRLTVEQWAKPFGKTNLTRVVLLRCADADTAAALTRLPPVSKLLGERIGDMHYVIDENDIKPLAAALEKAGFMAGLPAADPAAGSGGRRYPSLLRDSGHERTQPPREPEFELDAGTAKGLVYSRHSIAYFQMEARLPEPADLYPDLRDIPAAWLRDYRNYHPSTRKDMVEKAIEMRTLLQIRKDGADVRFAPRKVQETRGTWCMTGLGPAEERSGNAGEIRLLADEWQEMKLILPGINDKY